MIKSLTLDDNTVVFADLFVDATGFHKLLVNNLGWKEKIYKDYAIDRAVVGQLSYSDPLLEMVNYTQSIAQPYGWQFKIGLYHRMGSGYCFSSNHISDEKAVEHFLSITANRRTEPRLIKWTPKRLVTFAENNVATVGLCSGFYEPLEANSLFVLITGIKNLIEAISDASNKPSIDWTKYNNQLEYILDDISDFIKVHYTLSKRSDTPFWNDMQAIGKRDNHTDLLKSKYFDIRNSMIFANDHWSMFPDYMWMQLALSWGIDTSAWYPTSPDPEILNIAGHHFLTKEKKHDIISEYQINNFEWLKKEIFQNLSSSEWEEKYK
jgi:tryptophan halogenase